MTASLDDINEIVPYSVQHRPERLSDTFSGFISLSSDYIQSKHPARVDVIIATPATRWSAAGHSVTLFTFARFRKYFTIIEDLAPSLAHVYLQTGVLPIVTPVRAHLRRHTFEIDPRLMKYIRTEGLKLYRRRRDG